MSFLDTMCEGFNEKQQPLPKRFTIHDRLVDARVQVRGYPKDYYKWYTHKSFLKDVHTLLHRLQEYISYENDEAVATPTFAVNETFKLLAEAFEFMAEQEYVGCNQTIITDMKYHRELMDKQPGWYQIVYNNQSVKGDGTLHPINERHL